MAEERDSERESEGEAELKLPELPPVPTLPEAPRLSPSLPPRPKAPHEEEPSQYQRMGLAYTIPASLVAPILVLTLAGYWLDGHFHKSPYFTLGGALLGTISGFINMIRIANKLNR